MRRRFTNPRQARWFGGLLFVVGAVVLLVPDLRVAAILGLMLWCAALIPLSKMEG